MTLLHLSAGKVRDCTVTRRFSFSKRQYGLSVLRQMVRWKLLPLLLVGIGNVFVWYRIFVPLGPMLPKFGGLAAVAVIAGCAVFVRAGRGLRAVAAAWVLPMLGRSLPAETAAVIGAST